MCDHATVTSPVGAMRAPRTAVLVVAVAALLLAGWWATQARADDDPDATLHVCVIEDSGRLRAADDCRDNETGHVLATEAALQAAEARIADLGRRWPS